MTRASWTVGMLLAIGLACGVAGMSHAQAPPAAHPDRAAYDAAFKAMIADPGNLEKSFTFAELAIKVGDLEGAVAALERMLIIAPNLPRVRLELGVLYFRLGSYQTARRYLTDVLAGPDVPPIVRQRAEAFVAEIDRRIDPHSFSGTFMFGFRYQSNATAAPSGGQIRFGGVDSQLDRRFTSRSDVNSFLIGSFQHLWDLGLQGGEVWDTQAAVYVARQFRSNEVNLFYTSLSTGPRLPLLASSIPQLTIHPYVGLDYVVLGRTTDFIAPGGGATLEKKWADVTVSFTADLRWQDYHNASDRPVNDFRTGWLALGLLQAEWRPSRWLTLNATAEAGRQYARRDFESYREWLLGVAAQATLTHPPWAPDEPLMLTAAAARVWDDYRAPDPDIDPNTRRCDREWRLSLTLQVPLANRLAVVLQGARNSRSSTLPNYRYTNYVAMTGLTWRF